MGLIEPPPVSRNQETLHENNQKTSPPDAIFEPEMRKNVFAAGALPAGPVGELRALPRIPGCINGGPYHGLGGGVEPPLIKSV